MGFLLDYFFVKSESIIFNIPSYVFFIVLPLICPFVCYILFVFIGEIGSKNSRSTNKIAIDNINVNKNHFLYDWMTQAINKTKDKEIIEIFSLINLSICSLIPTLNQISNKSNKSCKIFDMFFPIQILLVNPSMAFMA